MSGFMKVKFTHFHPSDFSSREKGMLVFNVSRTSLRVFNDACLVVLSRPGYHVEGLIRTLETDEGTGIYIAINPDYGMDGVYRRLSLFFKDFRDKLQNDLEITQSDPFDPDRKYLPVYKEFMEVTKKQYQLWSEMAGY